MTPQPSSFIIPTASTAFTPNPTSSIDTTQDPPMTTGSQIFISMTSVALGVLLIAMLIYLTTLCRPRHQKYQHPENRSRVVDLESNRGVSVSKSSKVDSDSIDYSYSEDGYPRPTSLVNKYESLATHETHTVSLENMNTQPPKDNDNVEFDDVNLHSASSSSSFSKIKLAPLIIPEKPVTRANGGGSIKRSNPPEPSLEEMDDTASAYSEASAHRHSFAPPFKAPPVPSIPLRFITTPSTLPESPNSDPIAIARKPDEEEITTIPSYFPAPQPSSKSSGDNKDEAEYETEIYNVAKLLQSRQAKLPKVHNLVSRNFSTVAHIERLGSIKPVFSPSEERDLESYRPRYRRLKQKQGASLAPTESIPNPFLSPLPSAHPR